MSETTAPMQYKELPSLRAAYSDRAAALLARLCKLAYLPFETDEGEAALRAELDAIGFTLTNAYAKPLPRQRFAALMPNRGAEAYLAENEKMAVLVFRGTTDGTDWFTNLNINKKNIFVGYYDGEENYVKVHSGFYKAFEQRRNQIEPDIDTLKNLPEPVKKPIFITGHSLGGAMAQLATAAFTSDRIAACYTFGSPRAGERSLDQYVKPPHYRVTNGWDIVPFVPFYVLMYRHIGDTRHIDGRQFEKPVLRRRARGLIQQWVIAATGLLLSVLLTPFPQSWKRKASPAFGDHDIDKYVERLDILVRRRRTLTTTPN